MLKGKRIYNIYNILLTMRNLPTPPMFRRHPFNENPLCPIPEIGSTRGLPPRNVFLFNVAIDMSISILSIICILI